MDEFVKEIKLRIDADVLTLKDPRTNKVLTNVLRGRIFAYEDVLALLEEISKNND